MQKTTKKYGEFEVIYEGGSVVVDPHDPTAGREFRGTVTVRSTGDSWQQEPALTLEEKLSTPARHDLLGDIVRYIGDIHGFAYGSYDVKLEVPGTIKVCARKADDFKLDYGDATVSIYDYLLRTYLVATKP